MDTYDVLIAGAGPTGLALALWLTQQGVKVGIVDKASAPGTTSRAMAVQARTLELYHQLGLADEVIAAGKRNVAINLWVKGAPARPGRRRARMRGALPGRLRRRPFDRAPEARRRLPRQYLRPHLLRGRRRGHRAMQSLGLEVEKVHWFSTYRVHHRVTSHYRDGQVFLVGDAAHVHSPARGQGMNTGIGDAVNLAWKLAAVVRHEAPDSLLDSYETERLAFARKLVDTTDRLFTFITAEGNFADFVRVRIAPLFASVAYGMDTVREFLFRIILQITISYHDSPLSVEAVGAGAGNIKAGDRLPWVAVDGADNHAQPGPIDWQVQVYGAAGDGLRAWCLLHGMPLRELAWRPEHESAGFTRNASYLVRPDGHVALYDPHAGLDAVAHYFRDRAYRRFCG